MNEDQQHRQLLIVIFWSFLGLAVLINTWLIIYVLSYHKQEKQQPIREVKESLYRSDKGVEMPYLERREFVNEIKR